MPVLDQTTSNSYTGNGATTVFAYTFKLLDEADVLVKVDGVTKTLTTHYTVSGVGNSGGGNITFLSAPANAAAIVIQRDMDYLRETDYQDNGDLLAATLDEDMDRTVMQVQQVRDVGVRAIKIPAGETTDQLIAVAAASRANKAVVFDASGNVTISTDDYDDQLANVTAQAAAAAGSAAAASTSASTASTQASNASTSASTASTQASTATTQAGIATTKAGEAASSASSAASSATTATTATNDALAIYGSISAVNTAATNASNSASAAATSATNAGNSATAAAASSASASTYASTATTQATAAAASAAGATALYGSLGAVQAAEASATASATSASASATTATNQAAAAAASALSAASVVSQDLSAIDRTVFYATIVDTFLYDTNKDSDGGAWRKRCAHTSWENETLSGNWLGSAANETAARAISGATTGSYYYDTTAVGFYTLNAGSGKTATYRGNVRQFPAKVLITVEAARVVIWDLTQAGVPMWLVMVRGGAWATTAMPFPNTASGTSVVCRDGLMVLGTSGGNGVLTQNFISDSTYYRELSGYYRFTDNIGNRHVAVMWGYSKLDSNGIINAVINDVSITALPNAPVDVATGLPVPTIAVATDGNSTYSTSVIKDDGTVVNVASDSTGTAVGVEFDGLALKVIRSDGNVYYWNDVRALTTGASPSATVSASTTPAALGTASKQAKRALSSSAGLTLMLRNQLTLASSMLAYVTKDYNSGWMAGDIRGAWLADTVAETLTGTELVTNGTFTTDTSGWTAAVGATLSIDTARLKITNDGTGTNAGEAQQSFTTVVGKTYVLTLTGTDGSVSGSYKVGTMAGGTDVVANALAAGTKLINFVAASTTTHLTVRNNAIAAAGNSFFDNISCRLADVDRSVKAKGLQSFGSLTKAAVASGAALMGYSGFSAANYLEQPYNSDLDFGTGDFCIMGWAKFAATAAKEVIFCRDSPTTGKLIRLQVDATTSYLSASAYDGTTTRTATGAAAIDDATWKHVLLTYSAGTLTIYVNGVSYATATGAALLTLNNATAVCDIGVDSQHANPATNGTLAIWRAGATAPSADQIKQIYETERPMFEANAQCCLAGTSSAVTALAYDEETDLLHVGTSYGRSAFKGLVRVSSEATPVGAITALAASAGVLVQGGASGADVYVPAYLLREELLRDAEQMARFGQNLLAHDFTATASQTTFTLPVGWEIVAVYQQGAIKKEASGAGNWTRSFDGFKWSAVLGTGATVSDWISILAKRV